MACGSFSGAYWTKWWFCLAMGPSPPIYQNSHWSATLRPRKSCAMKRFVFSARCSTVAPDSKTDKGSPASAGAWSTTAGMRSLGAMRRNSARTARRSRVHRHDPMRQACLFEEQACLVTVGLGPVVQVTSASHRPGFQPGVLRKQRAACSTSVLNAWRAFRACARCAAGRALTWSSRCSAISRALRGTGIDTPFVIWRIGSLRCTRFAPDGPLRLFVQPLKWGALALVSPPVAGQREKS